MSEELIQWIPLSPKLGDSAEARRIYARFAQQLTSTDQADISKFRDEALAASGGRGEGSQTLRVALYLLSDLRAQGWSFIVDDQLRVYGNPPERELGSPLLEKDRIRRTHLYERDNQLRLPATREFVRNMERRRLGPTGWVSVFTLMRDGRELAAKLRAATHLPAGSKRIRALRRIIDPHIQIIDSASFCELTGLSLSDVWRYFRHTWATPYNSVPGRQMFILVRDRAAENHPVIGIAALSSAIVQLSPRDSWIGWVPEKFIDELQKNASGKWARWLWRSLDDLIKSLYIRDLNTGGILKRSDLKSPTKHAIERLLEFADAARIDHHRYPRSRDHKGVRPKSNKEWEQRARTHLFRSKRAKMLAELLSAKMRLMEAGFCFPTKKNLQSALESGGGRRACGVILKYVKGSQVGINMLDIIVCGAIQPYNAILGGKLIALMMASPEIVTAYESRYSGYASVIASSMAGKAVRRKPRLVLLGTTSLYGVSSSQYNRLKLPAVEAGGKRGEVVQYEVLGRSLGYGSYHLSSETVDEMEKLLAQVDSGRRVNSIFGEGVNPRLRKVRHALDVLGLPSDALLQHGNPRLVYGIVLASNFRDVLLCRTKRPRYILPQSRPRETTRKIAEFWMRRWLAVRIENEDVLKAVERHSVVYPLEHGAKVVLPRVEEEAPLFSSI